MCNYASKGPYSYIVIHSDEPLTKFEVWGKTKGFNTLYYDEERVLNLIQEKYPVIFVVILWIMNVYFALVKSVKNMKNYVNV